MNNISAFYVAVFLLVLSVTAYSRQGDATSYAHPESLRVSLEHGVFDWKRMRYTANLKISLLDEKRDIVRADQDYKILVDIKAKDASLWVDSDRDGICDGTDDHLLLPRDGEQVSGEIRWRISEDVRVHAYHGELKSPEFVGTRASLPTFIFIICVFGGALGGWLRRTINPKSELKLPFTLLPEKISKSIVPAREIFMSSIAGFLIYMLNLASPIYIGLKSPENADWFMVAEPLLIGFVGGWGGVGLLVTMIEQFVRRRSPAAA